MTNPLFVFVFMLIDTISKNLNIFTRNEILIFIRNLEGKYKDFKRLLIIFNICFIIHIILTIINIIIK